MSKWQLVDLEKTESIRQRIKKIAPLRALGLMPAEIAQRLNLPVALVRERLKWKPGQFGHQCRSV